MGDNKNEITWLDLYDTATTRTKTAAIFFVLAKLFFFFTCLSLFVGGLVLYLNLAAYATLVILSAVLCACDFKRQE